MTVAYHKGRRRGHADHDVVAGEGWRRPPMKPTPVKMPSGKRMRSFITNESGCLPAIGSRRST